MVLSKKAVEILRMRNIWWEGKKIPKPEYIRELEKTLIEELKEDNIIGLIGPRQGGKSTLLLSIISNLIKKGTEPKRILYIPIETNNLNYQGIIQDILSFALLINNEENPNNISKKIFLFFDEIQKLETWSDEIKLLYDSKLNIQIIISGSSSRKITKGAGESLLGRINHHVLLPLSFREIVSNKLQKITPLTDPLSFGDWKKAYSSVFENERKISKLFNNYLLCGGYPAAFELEEQKRIKTLQEYLDLSLQRDLFFFEELRDIKSIRELANICAKYSTERTNYSTIAGALGIKQDTVKKYIGLLEDIFIFKEAGVWSKPIQKARREKKIFTIDTGMINAITYITKIEDENQKPKLVENLIGRCILQKEFLLRTNVQLLYYLNKNRQEIDFIVPSYKFTPIEVKYRKKPIINDAFKEILEKTNKGLIITKDKLEEKQINNKKVIFVPAWLFVLFY